jgi:hypothetical protein
MSQPNQVSSSPVTVKDRDAVYYPHIHMRDKSWLNGTLLCFPHLVRLVPETYPLSDAPWVKEYFDTIGRRNRPLLQTTNFWNDKVSAAQHMLATKIREDIEKSGQDFIGRFDLQTTERNYSKDSFRISQDRLTIGGIGELYQVLSEHNLVWQVSPNEFGIHPLLGEAIMATIAMAYAQPGGMDVVTPSGRIHDVLAARRAEIVYDTLVRGKPTEPVPAQELVDDLALE